jgi:hypothetical protein
MATVLQCTINRGFNNTGTLKKLDNGYSQVVLSALEYPNSARAVYDAAAAERLLVENSNLQRRCRDMLLKGELGHPKESDSPNFDAFMKRVHIIEERNVAAHYRKVWIEPNYRLPDGSVIIAIMGEMCPSGPHAAHIERSMANPYENVCFSLRGMATDRFVNGQKRKYLDNLVTWDVVTEPGLRPATKFHSPACESYQVAETLEIPVNLALLEMALQPSNGCIATESAAYGAIEAIARLRRESRMTPGQSGASIWAGR